jgi:hypothetical protein
MMSAAQLSVGALSEAGRTMAYHRALLFGLAVAAAALAPPSARAETLCGIGNGPGCIPTTCSVLSPETCVPDEDFPLGGDLRLTINTASAEAPAPAPDHDLNTLRDLFVTLSACWTPPAITDAMQGMEMTVRVSYKRSGDIFAPPQLTYALEGASQKTRDTYRTAIAQSLAACSPLHFSPAFGGAVAGKPILIRYIDDRDPTKPQSR